MRSIESEGDTIDQAIENALRALNITRDQVEIEILTGATRGLLGFGGKKARVRATVRAPLLSRLRGLENEAADMAGRARRWGSSAPTTSSAAARRTCAPTDSRDAHRASARGSISRGGAVCGVPAQVQGHARGHPFPPWRLVRCPGGARSGPGERSPRGERRQRRPPHRQAGPDSRCPRVHRESDRRPRGRGFGAGDD